MLVVKLELHPANEPGQVQEIGKMHIANISDLRDVSDYAYEVWTEGEAVATGCITGHVRERGAWLLVGRVIYDSLRELVAYSKQFGGIR